MRFVDFSTVRPRFHCPTEAPDGTVLSVDLYVPDQPGPHPALLTRTPYDNNRSGRLVGTEVGPAPADLYRLLAAHGFVVAAVDVRGSGDSDGTFVPFRHEAADGAATVAWLAAQPECDGRVGMFGSGYAGFCAWAAASEAPPALAAICSVGAFGGPGLGMPVRGGAVRLDWLHWMHLVAGHAVQVDVGQWPSVLRAAPVAALAEELGRQDIWWDDWLEHAADDDWWEAVDAVRLASATRVPALHVAGGWDQGLGAALAYWRSATATALDGNGHRLVLGPWDTEGTRRPAQRVGGFDFGARSVVEPVELLLSWFDEHLGTGRPTTGRPKASVFVTGRNEWEAFPAWPPPPERRTTITMGLASTGRANSVNGDGRLVVGEHTADEQPEDEYRYDPARPVPHQPAGTGFARGAPFTLEQSSLEVRDDVLVYTSEPFTEPVLVAGRPELVLYAATDGPDTDWVALLSDVFPEGERSLHLRHAVVRAATVEGFGAGRMVAYRLEFDDLAHELLPGHRLRLCLTSSLFPLYARNFNDGDYLRARTPRPAEQRVAHDRDRPSRLLLPVLAAEGSRA